MWVSVLLLILIPIVLLADLFRARHPTRGDWMLAAGFAASWLLFVTLIGRWDFFSVWLPHLYFILLFVALYLPSRRTVRPATVPPAGYSRRGASRMSVRASIPFRALTAFALVALLIGSWIVYSGRSWSEEIPSLVFPLAAGSWFVEDGGDHALLNAHHGDPAQAFALHVVKLNGWGARALGFLPNDLERYEAFGETVYSPCAGTVLRAIDGQPDRAPSAHVPAPLPEDASGDAAGDAAGRAAAAAGNHVVVECDGREGSKVMLAHMQDGSIPVSEGDRVRMEDPVGRIGNSGGSAQPHLHIHVEEGGSPTGILDGRAVQVQYEGRHLVRGQVFRGEPRDLVTSAQLMGIPRRSHMPGGSGSGESPE